MIFFHQSLKKNPLLPPIEEFYLWLKPGKCDQMWLYALDENYKNGDIHLD
jgi:hypothetical protein